MPGVFFAVIVSALILAAHFLRSGPGALVLAALALIGLLFVKRPWASHALRGAMWAGAALMFWTGLAIARDRIAAGNPRVVPPILIMSAVGIFMVLAGLAVGGTSARLWFRFAASATTTPEPAPPAGHA